MPLAFGGLIDHGCCWKARRTWEWLWRKRQGRYNFKALADLESLITWTDFSHQAALGFISRGRHRGGGSVFDSSG